MIKYKKLKYWVAFCLGHITIWPIFRSYKWIAVLKENILLLKHLTGVAIITIQGHQETLVKELNKINKSNMSPELAAITKKYLNFEISRSNIREFTDLQKKIVKSTTYRSSEKELKKYNFLISGIEECANRLTTLNNAWNNVYYKIIKDYKIFPKNTLMHIYKFYDLLPW